MVQRAERGGFLACGGTEPPARLDALPEQRAVAAELRGRDEPDGIYLPGNESSSLAINCRMLYVCMFVCLFDNPFSSVRRHWRPNKKV